jgi:signal transduction histidine kinase/CheY-like chemotaxis protein
VTKLLSASSFRNNGIGRRMIVALILFSSAITAVTTAIELYRDYRSDIRGIESRFEFIRSSYLPTLVESVWIADGVQIETQLQGLSHLQDIEFLAIGIDGRQRWSAGAAVSTHQVTEKIPLVRKYRGQNVTIGTLHVIASVDNVLDRLWAKLVVVLIGNAVKTLLVAAFMLLIFQFMVGRHLESIALYVRSLGQDASGDELRLGRPDAGRWRPDALDHVTRAINAARRSIADFKSEVLGLNASLESRVDERTAQLAVANRELSDAVAEAVRASQAKSEFLSRMSHELRTPMNAILGFSQVLEIEPLSAEQQSFVREIHQAGEHLLELIDDLLDLSRIESGRMAIAVEAVALGGAVEQAVQLVKPLLQQRELTLIDECAKDVIVLADATRLKQVLVNLLSNAAKYNSQGGSVRVDSRLLDGNRIRLSVTDKGAGIAPEKIGKLFKPFERLGAELTAVEGTGIGLAISKRLVELMGGTIGVDSAPGQGSTFWIELPLAQAAADSAAAPSAADKFKVLYVEDNAANLKVVEAMLRRQPNLTLLAASNGEYGLELAQRYLPQVILLDIHLPGMDGYAVLKELQSRPETRDIPVIALSADAMPLDVERGLGAGFRHYLTKPIIIAELVATIGQIVSA